MAFLFKNCFEPNPHTTSLEDFDRTLEKQENPHQRLIRNDREQKVSIKQSSRVPNKFQVRGGWVHRGQNIDYTKFAHKQQKYDQFLEERRSKMELWNQCFEQSYQ